MSLSVDRFRFEPTDFFVLRMPLLPIDELLRWSADLETPSAPEDALESALARDYARLTERLQEAAARPEVREAIYLASPDLHERLKALGSAATRGEDRLRIARALVRYFTRMASRPTPFGLFAGVGVGSMGRDTELRLSARAVCRHVHLDMGYLEALMVRLRQEPSLRTRLRYQANSSISQSAGRLHYVETRHQGAGRVYTLAAVDASPELYAVLRRCEQPATLEELVAVLISDEVDVEEATSFVSEMIDAQLLVSDLEPRLTGSRSLEELCSELHAIDAKSASILSRVDAALRDIEAAPLGLGSEAYEHAEELLSELAVPSEPGQKSVFQVDMRLSADLTLGTSLVDEFARAAKCLLQIGIAESRPLDGFVAAFVERYELQEVPLLDALDEEVGIGLPPSHPDSSKEGAHAAQQVAMTRLLAAALADGSTEIALTDADVEAIAYRGPAVDLPPGFTVMGSVSATHADALQSGDFRVVLEGGSGPSGAMLFGRFCHNDPSLASAVARQLAAEEATNPDAIHAELVHLSEGRMGNVLARPVLRSFEIPFLGRSGAPIDRQLRLDDLMVSVSSGRIVLRSRRLQCEVIPHLTTAHNADLPDSPRVYRFLAHFQRQHNRHSIGWPWGALTELPFLPRVTYGRTVLSRARWMVSARELSPLVSAKGSARVRAVRNWRHQARLPRFVQLRDGDNALFVDFDNPLSVDVLLDLVKRRPSITLVELLPTPEEAAVTSDDGRFMHEIVVPFVRQRVDNTSALVSKRASPAGTPRPCVRRFPPGSEWLYAKLYCGIGIADRVLRDLVGPLVEQVVGGGVAERWFFLRYSDPHPHIRLRFFGDPRRLTADVLPALNAAAAPFIRDGRIWRVQLDTYEREVERYGGPMGVDLAERLFAVDSAAALSIVSQFGGVAHTQRRAHLTMAGIDRTLADFHLVPSERVAFLQTTAPDSVDFHRLQGDAYRRTRAALESALCGTDPELASGIAALEWRSRASAPIAAALRAGLTSGEIDSPIEKLLLSYTHMFVNRVEAIDPNQAERRYYDFIRRFHVGQLARVDKPAGPRHTHDDPAIAFA